MVVRGVSSPSYPAFMMLCARHSSETSGEWSPLDISLKDFDLVLQGNW